jgi:hypothetical protein
MRAINAVGVVAMVAVVGSIVARHVVLNTPPWTWDKAWLKPNSATRAQIDIGIDAVLCKTGTWHSLPDSAITSQEFLPAKMVDGKLTIINGAGKPVRPHPVHMPLSAHAIDQCRDDPIRLDTTMGVGLWVLQLETKMNYGFPWFGRIDGLKDGKIVMPDLVTIAPFEVTP